MSNSTHIRGKAQEAGWRAHITWISEIAPRKVQWLWPRKIPLGKLVGLNGNPGDGKSILTCDLAARVSTGAGWPDDPHARHEPGGVVFLSAEDDIADTIRPRLDAAGADCTKIVAIEAMKIRMEDGTEVSRCVDLSTDLPRIEAALEEMQAKGITPRLVIIDPITAYAGDTNSHVNAEVRTFLAPLAALAAKWNIAVVMVNHLNKGQASALYRTQGSIAFVAAVRVAFLLCRDPQNPRSARRLLLPLKSNLARDTGGLAFVLSSKHSANGRPICEWEKAEVAMSADEALAPPPQRKGPAAEALAEAVQFLRSKLADGPKLMKDVEEEAAQRCRISKATLKRARNAAHVEAYHPTNPGPWWLRLPVTQPEPLPPPHKLLEPLEPLPDFSEKTGVAEAQIGAEAQVDGAPGVVSRNGHDPDAINRLLAEGETV